MTPPEQPAEETHPQQMPMTSSEQPAARPPPTSSEQPAEEPSTSTGGEAADDDAPELVSRSDPVPAPAVFCCAQGCYRRLPQQANFCLRCTRPHVGGRCPLCSAIERLRRAALELDAESASSCRGLFCSAPAPALGGWELLMAERLMGLRLMYGTYMVRPSTTG